VRLLGGKKRGHSLQCSYARFADPPPARCHISAASRTPGASPHFAAFADPTRRATFCPNCTTVLPQASPTVCRESGFKDSDMNFHVSRRGLLVGAAAVACNARVALSAALEGAVAGTAGATGEGRRAVRTHSTAHSAASRLAALEKREGGRLGVAALDTATARRVEHRGDERFAMCSVFKFLAAGAVLKRVDQGSEHLDRRIEYGASDLLEYAPVSKDHVKEGGLTLGELCAAAVQWSDNTAANLVLKALGGPEAVTAFIRSTGDPITRLDRMEPELNVVLPGEVIDTTTAASMVGLLNSIVLGTVLSTGSRSRLQGWMIDAKVGEHRIPAGLPAGWRMAHKTGTGSDQTNDVGIIWPPNRSPIIVAALYSRSGTRREQREDVLREVGRIVAAEL